MAKIILINPDPNPLVKSTSLNFSVPMGLHVIANVLKKEGHEIVFLDKRLIPDKEMEDTIKNNIKDTLWVGFSVMTAQVSDALRWSKFVKKQTKTTKIVWGGIHCTIIPTQCLESDYIDFIVRGDGELAAIQISKFLKDGILALDTIKSLGYKKDNKIVLNEIEPFPMENIPITDWSIVDIEKYIQTYIPFHGTMNQMQIQTSRGCPMKCVFCINPSVITLKTWRTRPLEHIEKELENAKKLGAEEIFFRDENFFVNHKRALEIAHMCKKIGLKWEAQCRANYFNPYMLNEGYLKEIEDCGCLLIAIGAESGSNKVLKDIRKDITTEQILNSAKALSQTNIIGLYAFMIGFPTETNDDINQTIKLMKQIAKVNKKIFFANVAILRPYPGCEVYEQCKKLGYKDPQSLQEWADYDLATYRGALDLKNYPWIKNKNKVYAISLYMQFALAPLKAAPDLQVKLFSILSKIRLFFNFWYWPWEFLIFLKIKSMLKSVRGRI